MAESLVGAEQIIDSTGPDAVGSRVCVLVKTPELEIMRLNVPAGVKIPQHRKLAIVVIQCLFGRITVTVEDKRHELKGGQLIYLKPNEWHSLEGIEIGSLLVTVFKDRNHNTGDLSSESEPVNQHR